MSKIKNGGLDQYGKVFSLDGIGGESVKIFVQQRELVADHNKTEQ